MLLLAVAGSALAQAPVDQKPLATGFVANVNPFTRIISIHGGQLAIDAFEAEVRGPAPTDVRTFNDIRAGGLIAVVFKPGTYAQGQPIPATIVQILEQEAGTITGKIESVNAANKTFTVLGHVIRTHERTRFGSTIAALDKQRVEDLPVGRDVTVFVNSNTTALVADEVFIIAPPADEHIAVTGIVRKIEGDTWTLMRSTIETFKVTSRTQIGAGIDRIRIGDLVHVFGRVDDGVVTATSVLLARQSCPTFIPNPLFSLSGVVVERDATSLLLDNGTAVRRVRFNDETLYEGGDAVVGDNVDISVEKIGTEYLAKFVRKINHRMNFIFWGTVTAINPGEWLIRSSTTNTPDDQPFTRDRRVRVTAETRINGNPVVGEEVIVVVERETNGDMKGLSIDKRPH